MALIEGRSIEDFTGDTVTKLKAHAGVAAVVGSRVFPARSTALDPAQGDLPAINVHVDSETLERLTVARPPEFARQWILKMSAWLEANTDEDGDTAINSLKDAMISATVGDVAWGDDNGLKFIDGATISKEAGISGDKRVFGVNILVQIQAGYGAYDDA